MTRLPQIFALSPFGLPDVRVAAAACHARALGVLDLGTAPLFVEGRLHASVDCLAARVRGRGRRFGIRVGVEGLRDWGTGALPRNLGAVVVWGGVEAVPTTGLRNRGVVPIAEVTSREEAEQAIGAGFGGLIVVGEEAGGRVGDESAFVLLQAVLERVGEGCPVWVRGGIGPMAASGCLAMGAAGVVLDGALLLARESTIPLEARESIAGWDGTETTRVDGPGGSRFRVFVAPRSGDVGRRGDWVVRSHADLGWGEGQAWPVGQDAALAADLADRFVTTGGIIQEVERAIEEGLAAARAVAPLAPGSALAVSHGTRYPIVQGPMTRVSDRPEFARAVADGGALPLLALAMMRGDEVREVARATSRLLDGRAWGVGLLGFLAPERRREQVDAIRETKPPFALIAGGRPDQASELERAGIATYLHAPSPRLLAQFLREGARRFVLEGRECGGHVGPRSSLVLWEQAGRVVLDAIAGGVDPGSLQILHAGGVHDARSAAAVAAIAGPMAALGVRVGVLLGTAYLFTREAVESGAIVAGFQEEALACRGTTLLETGPGHLVRVSRTPFADRFEDERKRLLDEGRTAEEVREALDRLNVGRLRIATKGLDRSPAEGNPLVSVSPADQRARGLYMLGQAATLRDAVTTIGALHEAVGDGSTAWLRSDRPTRAARGGPTRTRRPRPSDVAIVGISAIVPGATDARTFWNNTLRGVDAITEVPPDRWDWRLYFDADPKAPDKITSRWGGFVPEIPFDPLRYGMPPTSLPSIEPLHLLTLEAVRAALDDAGYARRSLPRERTAVVLGAGGGAAQLAMGYAFRSYLPLLDTVAPGRGAEPLERCEGLLPEWTEDSFPGILLNVAAGRVANRFDFGGANYTVDAACGSSLAAAALAVRELESRAADVVVLGGADTVQNPFTYLAFSKTQAFSARGRCRPFDAGADGIVISEAVAVVVLKRLADAERDGDRIYAVIKGLGASSDGRAKGLTAPRFEGQVRALARAYEKAGVSPREVGYVEAHGTGTAAGDQAEVQALVEVFRASGAERAGCALGSVKSLIGHTKCAAGLAGLINAALAIHHRVLPPTIGVETPNPRVEFSSSPFHLSTKARPWLSADPSRPRRAGVSAFGFGGTNFHAVLEEYADGPVAASPALSEWPAELLIWRASDRAALLVELGRLLQALEGPTHLRLHEIAHALAAQTAARSRTSGDVRLSVVASTLADLREKLGRVHRSLTEDRDPSGVAYSEGTRFPAGRLAFLFPGQGSQTPGMLEELALAFPTVLDAFQDVDRVLARLDRPAVGPLVFPPPAWDPAEAERQRRALAATEVAQPALGAADVGLSRLLHGLGVAPAMLAGHSYGELVALHVGGCFSFDAMTELSDARGRLLAAAVGSDPGSMAAVAAGLETVEALIAPIEGVVIANANGPVQTVISGTTQAVTDAVAAARSAGLRAQVLPVSRAFHSPLVESAREPLTEVARRFALRPPSIDVYSNLTAGPYRDEPEEIAPRIGAHAVSPVRFGAMIEAMHDAGARVFVEVGPGGVLTGLVGSILGGRPHLALACDPPGRHGLAGFLNTLGRLFAAGVDVEARRLTAPRDPRPVSWNEGRFDPAPPAHSPSTWLVDGNRARPAHGPEPRRLGPGPALPKPSGPRARSVEPAGTPAPRVEPAATRPGDPVLAAYQNTMRQFLDAQRSTMLAYLAGRPSTSPKLDVAVAERLAPPPVAPSANGKVSTPPEPPAANGVDPVESRLLEIVRDRTGYPLETLGLDLDLEADLGIDSIKRVEVLGTLRESFPARFDRPDSTLIDDLTKARTLRAILEGLSQNLGAIPVPSQGGSFDAADQSRSSDVSRMLIEVVDAPFDASSRPHLVPGGSVVVTNDGRGVAASLERSLREQGFRPVLVDQAASGWTERRGGFALDLGRPEEVRRLVEAVRRDGPVSGLIHALPLASLAEPGLDAAAWARRMDPEVLGLFHLAKALGEALNPGPSRPGGALIAATALGGAFRFQSAGGDPDSGFFPGHGGVAGLVKTLAREWPGVRTRVVDLDPREPAEGLADRLLDEFLTADDRAEVGYLDGRRVGLSLLEQDLSLREDVDFSLDEGAPVLVTGGARGITAAVAADLAGRWRPRLLLVGSSPAPTSEDPEADRERPGDPAEVKARLFERLRSEGKAATPAEIERAFRRQIQDREVRANLARIESLGAAVEYAQADVRDARALAEVVGRWRARYGRFAGLIHGAGVIHDKLLRDKSPESIARVLGVKLEGALNLARLLDPEPPRFAAFFSSVAGRFGNRGQSDYAAANDALNKLAVWLDRRWDGRVVSINWGPWSGVGMVSDLEGHLGRRGMAMIDPSDGRGRLAEELLRGRKGEVEVVVAGDLGNLASRHERTMKVAP